MQNVPLPVLNRYSNISVVIRTGWLYQIIGYSLLITVKSPLHTRIGKKNNEIRKMTLSADEFIRRFLLHVLPNGFMKIRYFGFLSHKNKKQAIPLLRKLIDPHAKLPEKIKETIFEMMLRLTGTDINCCPNCKKGKMKMIKKLLPHYHNSS